MLEPLINYKNGFLVHVLISKKRDIINPRFTVPEIIADGNGNDKRSLNTFKYSFK